MLERGLVFTPSSITRIRYGVVTFTLLVCGLLAPPDHGAHPSPPHLAARVVGPEHLALLGLRPAVSLCAPSGVRGSGTCCPPVAHEMRRPCAEAAEAWACRPGDERLGPVSGDSLAVGLRKAHPSDASIAQTQSALAIWGVVPGNTISFECS